MTLEMFGYESEVPQLYTIVLLTHRPCIKLVYIAQFGACFTLFFRPHSRRIHSQLIAKSWSRTVIILIYKHQSMKSASLSLSENMLVTFSWWSG
ncbi:uncharacterized protein EI90DRAFT_3073209 [Cantharellus anzutake]|uniref:uncharacterized protein n=1 Tax=Cantharellus anzutake TaxID=1750568 RepID=UPI0019086BC5|nr:uncharacterized protein EI90DRAFT_3073209 [Cantharellus anzutake]KAF8325175.1 hypothetical protein EI90DRAFT_3073209 [Cantharellus anzutake]